MSKVIQLELNAECYIEPIVWSTINGARKKYSTKNDKTLLAIEGINFFGGVFYGKIQTLKHTNKVKWPRGQGKKVVKKIER